MAEFVAFPKIPRLRRDITITEKIDGTNAAIWIVQEPFGVAWEHSDDPNLLTSVAGPTHNEDGIPDLEYFVYAQSRTRMITPLNDNFVMFCKMPDWA